MVSLLTTTRYVLDLSLIVVMTLAIPSMAMALANPASVYCESRGGKVEIETSKDGAQTGICVFSDGTRVNEWAYFRSTHRTTK